MMYRTTLQVKGGAPPGRLELLQRSLVAFDCVVRLEGGRRELVLELPPDDYQWIVTGGFATLLERFEDCIAWRPTFQETGRRAAPARLPAPARRGGARVVDGKRVGEA